MNVLLLKERICSNSIDYQKIAAFANSIDLDEVTHNEPPHLDLCCLPSGL